MTVAMTIAGSDPSGGAGLQADLKTFHQHGVYGTSVVTLLTVQNTQKVESVEVLGPEFVVSQLDLGYRYPRYEELANKTKLKPTYSVEVSQ